VALNEEIMADFKSTTLKEGEGVEAKSGSTVKVHYTG
jgi:FKBP-type peptidyl-prolyl cis-trans isomerase